MLKVTKLHNQPPTLGSILVLQPLGFKTAVLVKLVKEILFVLIATVFLFPFSISSTLQPRHAFVNALKEISWRQMQ